LKQDNFIVEKTGTSGRYNLIDNINYPHTFAIDIVYLIPKGILIVLFVFYNNVIPSGLRNTNPEGMELL